MLQLSHFRRVNGTSKGKYLRDIYSALISS
uniref:Uncharacterized protein n=1 Tax=Rhizophora mucronata TaxID=61149 RepID=A0A2P2P3K2_RHIMU